MSPPVAAASPRFRFGPLLAATVLTVLLLWLFGTVAEILLLLFLGILIALYLGAVTDFLVDRLHLPRQVAFLAALLFSAALVVGFLFLLVPPIIEQTQGLLRVLPSYIADWEHGIEVFLRRFPGLSTMYQPGEHRLLEAAYAQLGGYFADIGGKLVSLVHAAIDIFAVFVMGIYLALYPGLYREWLIALFHPVHRDLVRDVLGDLADTLRRWIVGQLLTMTILGVLTAIGLSLLGVPYWLTFGVFTGLVAIIPFFGTLVSTLLPALFVLEGPGGGTRALLVVLLGVVIHLVESNVVAPLVMARNVELPPVLTIMAVLIFGRLLGPMGLLVAVPALAVLMVVVRRILINRIYEGQGFRRAPRDRVLVLRVPAARGGVLVPDREPPDIIGAAHVATIGGRVGHAVA
ncbi:MAG TPA: AI-2E family transporter [Gemmatimonadaceae bacterium]|nr:AI-2E family transporter [Gemmatimonadaceae bacterium]